MKYVVYQIQITSELYNEINSGVRSERAEAFLKMRMLGEADKAVELKMYSKTAEIEANDLEDVFDIGNTGPAEKITRIGAQFRSVSVGDIIGDPNGDFHVVENFGFKEIDFKES